MHVRGCPSDLAEQDILHECSSSLKDGTRTTELQSLICGTSRAPKRKQSCEKAPFDSRIYSLV